MSCGIGALWLGIRCGIRRSSVVRDELCHQAELSGEG